MSDEHRLTLAAAALVDRDERGWLCCPWDHDSFCPCTEHPKTRMHPEGALADADRS